MIKKIIVILSDLICFIGGVVLLAYNLFHIISLYIFAKNLKLALGYYKSKGIENFIIGFTVGTALIIFGFIVRNWMKKI